MVNNLGGSKPLVLMVLWGHGTWVTSDGFCMQFIGDFENEDKEDRQVEVMEVAWGKCHDDFFK